MCMYVCNVHVNVYVLVCMCVKLGKCSHVWSHEICKHGHLRPVVCACALMGDPRQLGPPSLMHYHLMGSLAYCIADARTAVGTVLKVAVGYFNGSIFAITSEELKVVPKIIEHAYSTTEHTQHTPHTHSTHTQHTRNTHSTHTQHTHTSTHNTHKTDNKHMRMHTKSTTHTIRSHTTHIVHMHALTTTHTRLHLSSYFCFLHTKLDDMSAVRQMDIKVQVTHTHMYTLKVTSPSICIP